MDNTHHHVVEAHIEWIGNTSPDIDYELVIRDQLVKASWIDLDSSLQIAGWDSVLVELNDATWERLVQEGYIEVEGDHITMGVEYEEDDTAGFIYPQDR